MSAKDFSFTGKVVDIEDRQAILAVDNDADTELLEKILKLSGIRILNTEKDGKTSLEMVRKHKTGLFFLDFDIDELGSVAVYDKIKATCPNIQIYVLAKQLNKEQVVEAREHGVVGFLVKPLTADAIKKLIKKI